MQQPCKDLVSGNLMIMHSSSTDPSSKSGLGGLATKKTMGGSSGSGKSQRRRRTWRIFRSPSCWEVAVVYGWSFVLHSYMSLATYQVGLWSYLMDVYAGLVIYTFIEYFFHRSVLHQWFPRVHGNHHARPRELRSISTPIVPVYIYDLTILAFFSFVLSPSRACTINAGIAIGQICMDLGHVIFHSTFRPWWLRSARSFHLYHHYNAEGVYHYDESMQRFSTLREDCAMGLTTGFWDMVFGSWPAQWSLSTRHPWIMYMQLPVPLLGFILCDLVAYVLGDVQPAPLSSSRFSDEDLRSSGAVGIVDSYAKSNEPFWPWFKASLPLWTLAFSLSTFAGTMMGGLIF